MVQLQSGTIAASVSMQSDGSGALTFAPRQAASLGAQNASQLAVSPRPNVMPTPYTTSPLISACAAKRSPLTVTGHVGAAPATAGASDTGAPTTTTLDPTTTV